MKIIKKLTSFILGFMLLVSSTPAWSSTPQDAVPVFSNFSTNYCVRNPIAVFTIPDDVKPYKYLYQRSYDGNAWEQFGEGLINGSTINLPLYPLGESNKRVLFIRAALQYKVNSTSFSTGPFSANLPIPEDTIWTDSEFCNQKRAAEALAAKNALLPGSPQIISIRYFDNSTIVGSFDRPIKAGNVTGYIFEGTYDGANWIQLAPKSQPRLGATKFTSTLINPEPGKNLTMIRIKAQNSYGSGEWQQASTGRQPGPSQVVVQRAYSTSGYSLFTNPIALPGIVNSSNLATKGCTFTAVELGELNAINIVAGDQFRLETSLEDLGFVVNKAPQIDGQIGLRIAPNLMSGADVTKLGFRVQLCPDDITQIVPRFLKVRITKTSDSSSIEGLIKVLQQNETLGAVIEAAKMNCGSPLYSTSNQSRFGPNVLIEQSQIQNTASSIGIIKGTVFRLGMIAPNQEILVFVKTSTSYSLISKLTTDADGQFSMRFTLPKSAQGSSQVLYLSAQESASSLFNEVFASFEIPLTFKWTPSGLIYQTGTSDWIPTQTSTCDSSLQAIQNANNDEKNSIAWFIAKKVLYGMKNKSTRSSQQTSTSSGSVVKSPSSGYSISIPSTGRCYVSGYTTKSGKRVSGYYRRC